MQLHARLIKPEFYTDGELLRWPRDKRNFYAGLFHLADDSGCLEFDAFEFKLQLFRSPQDVDLTVEILEQFTQELSASSKLIPYEINGKMCFYLKNFHRHQTLKNPSSPMVALPVWVTWQQYPSNPRSGKYIVNENLLTAFLRVRTFCPNFSYTDLVETVRVSQYPSKSSSKGIRIRRELEQEPLGSNRPVLDTQPTRVHAGVVTPPPPPGNIPEHYPLCQGFAAWAQERDGKPLFCISDGATAYRDLEGMLSDLDTLTIAQCGGKRYLFPVEQKARESYWRAELGRAPFTRAIYERIIRQVTQDIADGRSPGGSRRRTPPAGTHDASSSYFDQGATYVVE